MGIAVTIRRAGSDISFPVAGNTEVQTIWKPIIDANDLHFLDCIVTAGLSIDRENREGVLREMLVLRSKIDGVRATESDAVDPLSRCDRLIDALKSYSDDVWEMYVG